MSGRPSFEGRGGPGPRRSNSSEGYQQTAGSRAGGTTGGHRSPRPPASWGRLATTARRPKTRALAGERSVPRPQTSPVTPSVHPARNLPFRPTRLRTQAGEGPAASIPAAWPSRPAPRHTAATAVRAAGQAAAVAATAAATPAPAGAAAGGGVATAEPLPILAPPAPASEPPAQQESDWPIGAMKGAPLSASLLPTKVLAAVPPCLGDDLLRLLWRQRHYCTTQLEVRTVALWRCCCTAGCCCLVVWAGPAQMSLCTPVCLSDFSGAPAQAEEATEGLFQAGEAVGAAPNTPPAANEHSAGARGGQAPPANPHPKPSPGGETGRSRKRGQWACRDGVRGTQWHAAIGGACGHLPRQRAQSRLGSCGTASHCPGTFESWSHCTPRSVGPSINGSGGPEARRVGGMPGAAGP